MENMLMRYAKDAESVYRRIIQNAKKHRILLYRLALVAAAISLIVLSLYAGYKASKYFSTNSDALIATQQFSGGLRGNTVALPGSHANILMIPLLYLQGHLPYHFMSFAALNAVLIFATVAGWGVLLIWLFGRKYEIPILFLLSALIFTSVTFNLDIGNTTFRNIAYPIALWFVLVIAQILKSVKLSRYLKIAAIVSSILFTVLLAGDGFFNYAIVLPIVLVLVWFWLRARVFTKSMLRALGLLAAVMIGSSILKLILSATEFIYFDNAFLSKPTILPSTHLGPSIQIMLTQLMDLQGGNFFGRTVSIGSLGIFINFVVLAIGIMGLVAILRSAHRAYQNKNGLMHDDNFVLSVMAVSFFTVILEYVFSGYVVTQLADGSIISYLNSRYITLMPLIVILGVIWILKNRYQAVRHSVALCLLISITLAVSYSNIRSTYLLADQQKAVPSQSSIDQIVTLLNSNHVSRIVTDFWYGPPIRFRTSDAITYAPQIDCNKPLPFDSREDWFKPQPSKSALIIDRGGLNYGYWNCTDQDLVEIYGKPVKQVEVAGVRPGEIVKIWIYNYDVTQQLLPFPEKI